MNLITRAAGAILDYDEALGFHTAATDEWRILCRCWYWLAGPGASGKTHGEPYDTESRRAAEADRVLRGWHLETVVEAREWMFGANYHLPKFPYRKAKKVKASTGRTLDDDGDDESDQARLRRWAPPVRVGRDWEPTWPSDERKHELAARMLRGEFEAPRGGRARAVAEVIYA